MKNAFLGLLASLVVFSQFMVYQRAAATTAAGLPVLYWATDNNITRQVTVDKYRLWLKKNGYPDMDVKVDNINGSLQKLVIQGAAGVGPDIMNVFGWDLHYLNQIGMVAPLDALMGELAVPRENHDPTVSNELYSGGKRMGYSQNAGTSYYFVNLTWLGKIGMPPPPERWTVDSFEAWGREYVAKANRDRKESTRSFLMNHVDRETFRRSYGLSYFNETLSACVLDRPEHVALLKRIFDWTYTERFLATRAEAESFTVEAGRGGGNWSSLFHKGIFAMAWSGLPILISLRDCVPPIDLGIAECPSGGYRNSVSRTYATALYSGSPNHKLARYFLLYLTSEPHNLEIAENGDQMPPIPSFRERDAFLKPPAWPNEWNAHRVYKEKSGELGTPSEYSPFIAYNPYQKIERNAVDAYFSKVISAEEACSQMEERINAQIKANLDRSADLRALHAKALATQAKIDALKRAGKQIPLELVENPFLRRYFRETGRGI